jgi:HK97 family phage major capsid protein
MKDFQRWRIALFALFAMLVAAFVVTGIGAPDALTLCVDWFQGFTGHTDGLLMAAAPIVAAVGSTGGDGDTETATPVVPAGDGVEYDQKAIEVTVREAVRAALGEIRKTEAPKEDSAIAKIAGATRVIADRTPNWQRRAVALMNVLSATAQRDPDKIERFTARLRELQRAVTPQLQAAERAVAEDILKDAGFKGLAIQRTMSTLSDGAGAYDVPIPMAAEIYVVVEQHSIARANSRPIQVVNKSLDLTSIATKMVAYWKAELALYTAADLVLGTASLEPSKLTGLTSWSNELTEDEQVALLPYRIQSIGEAFALQEDLAFFLGDGSTYGSTVGLLNLANAVGVTQAGGETTHASASLAYLRQMRDQVTIARRTGSAYYMHPDILSIIEVEGSGTASTNLAGFTVDSNGEIARIWGYPYVLSEDMPATAAAGEPYVIFGNPSQYVLRGEKGGVQMATSREGVISDAGGAILLNALQQDATILVARERIAFAVPGAFEASFSLLTTAAA